MRTPDYTPPRRRHRPRRHQPGRQRQVPPPGTNLVRGHSGLAEITKFDVSGYEHQGRRRGPRLRRVALDGAQGRPAERAEMHYGVAAAKQAIADSGFEITDAQPDRRRGRLRLRGRRPAADDREPRSRSRSEGRDRVPPTFIANALVDSTSGMIAIETGAIGHNVCIVSACATGTHNVAEGAEAIRRGDCIAVISGSTEAPLLEIAHAGFSEHARHGHAPARRAAPDGVAAVRPDPRRVRPRRGRRLAVPRGPRAGQGPRRADLRRGRRLRLGGRRLGHDPADRRAASARRGR